MRAKIGVALGSGSARGWAHIGVLRELEARELAPDVVCGTSIGALVGAAWAAGRLDDLEEWVRRLAWRDVVGFLDLSWSGGLFAARRLFEFFARHVDDVRIEDLDRPFAAVATDLETGHEVWLREGSLMEAVRASIAIPGLITPRYRDGRWLVDGGLVNPVPVSVCRALGAERVIGVDLQSQMLGRWPPHGGREGEGGARPALPAPAEAEAAPPSLADAGADAGEGDTAPVEVKTPTASGQTPGLWQRVQERARELMERLQREEAEPDAPSIFEVMAGSIDVMQVRISRSRLAGDPPDLLVAPRLPEMGLLDYHLAEPAIEAGRVALQRAFELAAVGASEKA